MFKIQPVRSKELQKNIADSLKCKFHENTYAFFAGELTSDASEIAKIIAMCQFEYTPDYASIKSLAIADGSEKDEAITILIRTVMNFCYRAGIPVIYFDEESISEEYLRSIGFRNENHRWTINLKKFYVSPCRYNNEEN